MVHDAAATGFERGSGAYQRARPSYHADVLDAVARAVRDRSVVELGAGTGIATAALIDRGLNITAVEPVAAMREALIAALPAVDVREGTAENMPVDSGTAGAVLAAQAFHWFDHGPALDEIARVLAADGVLITLWNVRDESVPWMAQYTAIQDRVQGDTPRYRSMAWRRAIEDDIRFELSDELRVPNPQPSNADHTVARFLSTSFIASLPEAQREGLVAEVRGLVTGLGRSYDFPYFSEVQIWKKVSRAAARAR